MHAWTSAFKGDPASAVVHISIAAKQFSLGILSLQQLGPSRAVCRWGLSVCLLRGPVVIVAVRGARCRSARMA